MSWFDNEFKTAVYLCEKYAIDRTDFFKFMDLYYKYFLGRVTIDEFLERCSREIINHEIQLIMTSTDSDSDSEEDEDDNAFMIQCDLCQNWEVCSSKFSSIFQDLRYTCLKCTP